MAVMVVAALVAASPGSATRGERVARTNVLLIRPGHAIGRVTLAMTQAQVRARLGRPLAVYTRRAGFGLRSVEWQYDPRYNIRFRTRRGQLRVDRIGSTFYRARTARGVGVGSLERDLRRLHPQIRCEPLRIQEVGQHRILANERRCTLFDRPPHRTVFTSAVPQRYPWDNPRREHWDRRAVVFEVTLT